jgi:hypothetical protein
VRAPAAAPAAPPTPALRLPLPCGRARPRQAVLAAWRAYAGDAGQVAPGGPHGRTLLHPRLDAPVHAHSLHSLSSPAARAELVHRLHPETEYVLAGVGCSGHLSSPSETPSSSEHHLPVAQLVLTLARHGIVPILGNLSQEFGFARRRRTAPWAPHLRFTSHSPFSRTSTPPCP